MDEAERQAKLRIFKDLPLVDKIIIYERGEIHDRDSIAIFFQEMINTGVCWSEEMHSHYTCYAANYIRQGWCAESTTVPMPEEAKTEAYLFEDMWIGYDIWGRPPTHEDWGRPLRWKEIRRERVKRFKANLKKKKGGEAITSKNCCK